MRVESGLALVSCCMALARPLSAQATQHPSFAGTWAMDTARSDKSPSTPAVSTYIVAQHGDTLTADRTNISRPSAMMPEPVTLTSHLVWATDGHDWHNVLPLVGAEAQTLTTASWAGDTMVVRIAGTVQGAELVQVDRWVISADGATLTIQRKSTYNDQPMGSPLLIFARKRN